MRLWNVDPKLMCDKHMLGEHVETHMFIGSIRKGRSLKGHIEKGQVEVHNIIKRHDELVIEMERRGMVHKSPLAYENTLPVEGCIDPEATKKLLMLRCGACRIKMYENSDEVNEVK